MPNPDEDGLRREFGQTSVQTLVVDTANRVPSEN